MMGRLSLLFLAAIAACAPAGSPPEDLVLGRYRFVDVNGQAPPVEFPAGSGAYLDSGTLELGAESRFELRFTARTPGTEGAAESGPVGSFEATADSLFFTPDGAEEGATVRFRYQSRGGALRLWDTTGNVWYYRREAPAP